MEMTSLRTADAFPVVASLLPKIGGREATTGNASAVHRLGNDEMLAQFVFPFVAREFVRNFIVNGRQKLSICLLKNTNQFQYPFSKKKK